MAENLPAKISHKALAILLLGFVTSCSHFSGNGLVLPESYHVKNHLLPENLNAVISWHQHEQEEPLQFLAFIEFSDAGTHFVALHSSGMRMFTLTQKSNGNNIEIESSFFSNNNIKAEQLYKDLLLSYLNADFIQDMLEMPLQLISNSEQRRLVSHEMVLKKIDYIGSTGQQASFTGFNQKGKIEYRFDISLQQGRFQ